MQIITAPSKTQSIPAQLPQEFSQPLFLAKVQQIIDTLASMSATELSTLLRTSDKLTQASQRKIQNFCRPFTLQNSSQALFTFQGDAYSAIRPDRYSLRQLQFAQNTLVILSGLYGMLRPLDLMQPYRLEMGTKLQLGKSVNLYQFWQQQITQTLSKAAEQHNDPTLVNLASAEYSKVIDRKKFTGRILTVVFKQKKDNGYATIPIHAKRARGMMIQYVMENMLDNPEDLKGFATEGYRFDPQGSTDSSWLFRKG